MSVAVPEEQPLALRAAVEDPNRKPLILPARARKPVLHEAYRASCAEAGIAPRNVAEVATIADLLTLVAGGLGIAHALFTTGLA